MNEKIFMGMKNGLPIFCDEEHYHEMSRTSFAQMNGYGLTMIVSGTADQGKIIREDNEDSNNRK